MASAAALGLDLSVLGKLEKALAAGGPNVIWLSGASCTGCTVSLANLLGSQEPTDVGDLLINHIDLMFHPNLMGAAGDTAVANLKTAIEKPFVMAVEGGIPTAFNGCTCFLWTEGGHEVTAQEAVTEISKNSNLLAILSIGSCASFGGIPAGNPNPTGIRSVGEITGKSTINIPGCPTHPDWIAWTIANLIANNVPALDYYGRPRQFFSGEHNEIHERCPREEYDDVYARSFATERYCLERLGCKGERTQGDCPTRKWNGGKNWCIGANSICLGCTERGFPDSFSPFYTINYSYNDSPNPDPDPDPPPDPDPNPDPNPIPVSIGTAAWTRKGHKLVVAGIGPSGAVITIKNADNGEILGHEEVGSDGEWEFEKRIHKRNGTVPCRVRCEVRNDTSNSSIAQVRNAPNCDDD
jgi:hydrogenase small subunit